MARKTSPRKAGGARRDENSQTALVAGGELLVVLVAVVIGATVKAVTGMGLPLLVIPIAALFVDIETAVVVIALPNLVANLTLCWRERGHRNSARDLPVLTATSLVGALLGTLLFVNVREEPLIGALIAAIVGYVVLFFAKPDFDMDPSRSRRFAPIAGTVAGGFQGAIGISGPIIGSWLHSYRLPRGAHIFSITWLFSVSGSAQLFLLLVDGQFSGRVTATLLACIPVLATIPIGTRLRDRVSSRNFDLAIVGLLATSAVSLGVRTFIL